MGPSMEAISPGDVFFSTDSDTGSDDGGVVGPGSNYYYILKFPDSIFFANTLRTILGRGGDVISPVIDEHILAGQEDEGLEAMFSGDHHNLLIPDALENNPRKRKRSTTNESIHFSDQANSNHSNGPQPDIASNLTNINQITVVGGIGGPQVASEDPNETFCAIHPAIELGAANLAASNLKQTISKRHLDISWDDNQGWVLEILGKNGVYVNQNFHVRGEKIRLEEGDFVALFGVGFFFATKEAETYYSDSGDEASSEASQLASDDEEVVLGEKIVLRDQSSELEDSDEDDDDHAESDEELARLNNIISKREGSSSSLSDSESDGEDDAGEAAELELESPLAKAGKKTKKTQKRSKTIKLSVSARKDKSAKKQPQEKIAEKQLKDFKAEKRPKDTMAAKRLPKDQTAEKQPKDKPAEKRPPATFSSINPQALEPQPTVETNEIATPADQPQRKRGPGRPPADGVMSKRERRERQKAKEAGIPYGEPLPGKLKRPRTDSEVNGIGLDANGSAKKAKKSKRDVSGTGGDDAADDQAGEGSVKRETASQQARAPSPKESDYPPERLAKPEETYQGLLHIILSESTSSLPLPQIYDAIKNKWPYYRFKTDTNGWESSVRHNLQSSECFKKDGKAGKGWNWTINPDKPFITKAKKPSPPAPSAYQTARPIQHGMHMPVHGMYHQGYPGYPSQHSAFVNGQRTQQLGQPMQQSPFAVTHHTLPPGQQARLPQAGPSGAQRPPMPASQLPNQSSAPGAPNYSSPYTNSTSQPHPMSAQQLANARLPNGNFQGVNRSVNRPPVPGNMSNHASAHSNPSQLPVQRSAAHYGHNQASKPGTPGLMGQQQQGSVLREPLASHEIRAGRTPAVVSRFMAQLKRISGNDADRTVKQAQIALQWIMNHPDNDQGIEHDPSIPKSMVTVLRDLIAQQSNNPQPMAPAAPAPVANRSAPLQTSTPASLPENRPTLTPTPAPSSANRTSQSHTPAPLPASYSTQTSTVAPPPAPAPAPASTQTATATSRPSIPASDSTAPPPAPIAAPPATTKT